MWPRRKHTVHSPYTENRIGPRFHPPFDVISPRGVSRRAEGRCVGEPIGDKVGHALRRARRARGLTLREVGVRSGGMFTPTAVAGYERGERSISLQRFCDIAAFYGIAPEDLLSEARASDDREPVVDLTPFESPAPTSGGRKGRARSA